MRSFAVCWLRDGDDVTTRPLTALTATATDKSSSNIDRCQCCTILTRILHKTGSARDVLLQTDIAHYLERLQNRRLDWNDAARQQQRTGTAGDKWCTDPWYTSFRNEREIGRGPTLKIHRPDTTLILPTSVSLPLHNFTQIIKPTDKICWFSGINYTKCFDCNWQHLWV